MLIMNIFILFYKHFLKKMNFFKFFFLIYLNSVVKWHNLYTYVLTKEQKKEESK